jgi:predicted nucleic acid-binding protein
MARKDLGCHLRDALVFCVLVYALDSREPEKRERARVVLRRVCDAGTAALPAQVLSEFGGACLSKLEPRPDAQAIRREDERLMLAFPVLVLTGPVVLEALRGVGEHMLSYHDAQIWAIARLGPVGVILSEDFNPGAVLDGVSFTNPLDTVHSTSPPWARSSAADVLLARHAQHGRTGHRRHRESLTSFAAPNLYAAPENALGWPYGPRRRE